MHQSTLKKIVGQSQYLSATDFDCEPYIELVKKTFDSADPSVKVANLSSTLLLEPKVKKKTRGRLKIVEFMLEYSTKSGLQNSSMHSDTLKHNLVKIFQGKSFSRKNIKSC